MPTFDYYEVLEVHERASQETIEAAYKALAKKLHPDNGGPTRLMQMVNEAYDVLRDPVKRAAYDGIRCGGTRNSANSQTFSSAAEFDAAYTAAMKAREGQENHFTPQNLSSIEWARVPKTVRSAYWTWSDKSSIRNWLAFLGSLIEWKNEDGPALVGSGVLATRFSKANGLPGFAETVDPLESLAKEPHGHFPCELLNSFEIVGLWARILRQTRDRSSSDTASTTSLASGSRI